VTAPANTTNTAEITQRDPALRAIAAALSAPFEPKDIKFKPQMVKNNRALAMAYIDARLIQDRLDDVLGVENWQDKYDIQPDGSVVCRLRLKLGGRWITKTDVGSPSEQPDLGDRLKAAFSDALKRAAVKFGIGRYLYRLPAQWVDYDPVKKQLAQLPQLPAFAIPKTKAQQQPQPQTKAAAAVPASTKTEARPDTIVEAKPSPTKLEPIASVASQAHAATKPESPKTEVARPEAAKTEAGKTEIGKPDATKTALPANGLELHRRLQDYDAKLAALKLCVRGALLAHVTQAGVKAGYTANMAEWAGPAIPFAVEAVKEFEQSVRPAASKSEPRTAA
jgi:hypothetical protein